MVFSSSERIGIESYLVQELQGVTHECHMFLEAVEVFGSPVVLSSSNTAFPRTSWLTYSTKYVFFSKLGHL